MTQLICFEGLAPWIFGTPTYIKRGLLDRLDLSGARVWRGSFMSRGPSPMPLALSSEIKRVIVVGHSMGGASAIAWCRKWSEDIPVDLLLTLDPRPLHRPYVKPANVKRAVNFYQTGFMRGYPVEGAVNVRVTCGHTAVPALKEVRELLEGYLREV